MSSEELQTKPPAGPVTVGGLKKKTLVTVGIVVVLVWAFAIQTGSVILMSIVGALTLALIGVIIWVLRLVGKQKKFAAMIQGAAGSPEARREALARLENSKEANEATHVFARAQLEAADDPARALETLEALEMKRVPAQLQDDVAILRAQLYLHFGRPKDARPLCDLVNVDNADRKDARGMMVAVVAEAWARTGKHQEALAMLETVDFEAPANEQGQAQLLVARAFARFASGKKGGAREDLKAVADLDVNHLGRFLMPQFRVHPELQKLARAVAEKHPAMRKMAKAQQPRRGQQR